MKFSFIFSGVISFAVATLPVFWKIAGHYQTAGIKEYSLGLSFFLLSVFLVRAGIKKYEGSWPTIIGSFCLCFAIAGLGDEADVMLSKLDNGEIFEIVLVAVLLIFGVLLVKSGQKLHSITHELSALKMEIHQP